MEQLELKRILASKYGVEKWKGIFSLMFNKLEYFTAPEYIHSDNVTRGAHIGNVRLDDGKTLAIFEIEVADRINIKRNRKGLRDITVPFIDQSRFHGALVLYFSARQQDYRFTYIAKQTYFTPEGELKTNETAPKRYTFLLGENESCTTAAIRILSLAEKRKKGSVYLIDVTDAFSVEKLNKEFFDSYVKHYKNFVSSAIGNEQIRLSIFDIQEEQTLNHNDNKPIRDFVKQMMGRIVFLHFLQKKGWMGCPAGDKSWENGDKEFMQNLFINFNDKARFYSDCLAKLFFNTLNNNERGEEQIFSITGTRVPFLNGGLFDEDMPRTRALNFSDVLFNDLFEFFSQYNFTIDENSPEEQEVGIDPEMLGHIFENLLEDNKDKGTFYTPKDIVHYMCQESLLQYLRSHLGEHPELDKLIREGDAGVSINKKNWINQNGEKIETLLDDVKICDPAIGSGAFPMGMLYEIFKAKKALDRTLNDATVKKNIIQNSIYGVDIEKGAVDIARLRFWLALVVDESEPQPLPNLDFKIMQGNSLLESYKGIDLSNISEEEDSTIYAKKGIIDFGEEYFPNYQNTLFDSTTKKELQYLISIHFDFDPERHSEFKSKNAVKNKINSIVEDKLLTKMESEKKKIEEELAKERDIIKKNHISPNQPIGIRRKYETANTKSLKKLASLETKLEQTKNSIEELKQMEKAGAEKPYFLWHTFFKDVFDKEGFDIVIGNPPYIKEYTNRSAFDGFRESSPYYQGKMDLWYGFACHCLDLTKKDNGILSFIATNNWTTNAGASKMRNKICKDAMIVSMIDFGDYKIFNNAGIQTMVMIFRNARTDLEYKFDYRRLKKQSATLQDVIDVLGLDNNIEADYLIPTFNKDSLCNSNFTFSNNYIDFVLQKISSQQNFSFDSKEEIAQGIVFPQDFLNKKNYILLGQKYSVGEGIFELTTQEKDSLELSSEELSLIKPYYTTEQIHRYYSNPVNNLWIIYTGSGFKDPDSMNPYPKLKAHLDRFTNVITSDNKPYGLHRARDERFFTGEKIIVQRKCVSRPSFSYADFDSYVSATFYVIKTDRVNQKYLLGLLNSKLIEFWLKNKGKMQGSNFQLDKEPLLEIPIYQPDEEVEYLIANCVDYIIFLRNEKISDISDIVSNNFIANYFEEIVDGCVYELYFKEHMTKREINILDEVEDRIIPIDNNSTTQEKASIILDVFNSIKKTNNPIRTRLELFVTRSPEYLKPIIQV